jgi:hypothetical protein
VKVNYGIKPDEARFFSWNTGRSGFFDRVRIGDFRKEVRWIKFKDITQFAGKNVDVPDSTWRRWFRWNFVLSKPHKHAKPEAFILAEVYNLTLQRLHPEGKMDYPMTSDFTIHFGNVDSRSSVRRDSRWFNIEHHMLHLLENHDEQTNCQSRVCQSWKAMPAMVVSTISTSTMIYSDRLGKCNRKSRFDPSEELPSSTSSVFRHQRWMNGGLMEDCFRTMRKHCEKKLLFRSKQNAI